MSNATKIAERRQKYTANNRVRGDNDTKIKCNLDTIGLNIICSYIIKDNDNIRRAHLINLANMIDLLDLTDYENDPDRMQKINFIKRALDGKLVCNIKDPDMLIKHINGGLFSGSEITTDSSFIKPLTNEEINWVNGTVTASLKFGHFYYDADRFLDVCTRLKSNDFENKEAIVNEFEELLNKEQAKFRKAKVDSHSEALFSLRGGVVEESIKDIYDQLVNPSVRLRCGMRGLNELTGGGFESGRVYMFFGLPGEGKSTVLLNLAYQIKRFNKNYKPKDKTKVPCIVFLTMENTVRETVERLFTMCCSAEMTSYNVEQAIELLRTEGELYLNDNSPIDIIIKFMPDRSVDTSYLYQLTADLEDDGYEVICLIQDYVKRIRSCEAYSDIRLELGAVVNEFKTFASIKDVPVITASQLNREASKHIDEGRAKGHNDLVRLMGRSNIGESMLMLENVDCSFMIAPEFDKEKNRYMGIQRVKIRYKAKTNFDYMYQPFTDPDSIRFVEDQDTPEVAYKTSLKPDMGAAMYSSSNTYNANTMSNMRNIDTGARPFNDIDAAMNAVENNTKAYGQDLYNTLAAMSTLITPFIIQRNRELVKPFYIIGK